MATASFLAAGVHVASCRLDVCRRQWEDGGEWIFRGCVVYEFICFTLGSQIET